MIRLNLNYDVVKALFSERYALTINEYSYICNQAFIWLSQEVMTSGQVSLLATSAS